MPENKHIDAGDIKPNNMFMMAGQLMIVHRIYEVDDPDYIKIQFSNTHDLRLLMTMTLLRKQFFILY